MENVIEKKLKLINSALTDAELSRQTRSFVAWLYANSDEYLTVPLTQGQIAYRYPGNRITINRRIQEAKSGGYIDALQREGTRFRIVLCGSKKSVLNKRKERK